MLEICLLAFLTFFLPAVVTGFVLFHFVRHMRDRRRLRRDAVKTGLTADGGLSQSQAGA